MLRFANNNKHGLQGGVKLVSTKISLSHFLYYQLSASKSYLKIGKVDLTICRNKQEDTQKYQKLYWFVKITIWLSFVSMYTQMFGVDNLTL